MDQVIKDVEEELNQFIFLVWYTNPTTRRIRLILDDGSVRLYLSQDKFIDILHNLLQPRSLKTEKNLFLIKESCNMYGKYFFYDRMNDEFRELLEDIPFEKIKPSQLIEESRKQLSIKESLSDNYRSIQSSFEEKTKNITNTNHKTTYNRTSKFFSILRNFVTNNNKNNKF